MNRIALGVAEAIILIALLVVLPLYAADVLRSAIPGFNPSAILGYFFSTEVLAVGAILAVVSGLSTALRGPMSSGAAKIAQGALGVLYFYLLFHGGNISMSLAISNITLVIGLDLTLMIYILYIGGLLRVVQGALIMIRK